MHIASLEAHTTLNIYNLWKLALRGHLNTHALTRVELEPFDHKNDAIISATAQYVFDPVQNLSK